MTEQGEWRHRPRVEATPVPSTPRMGTLGRRAASATLIKPELGKVRQTTYTLPGPAHTYGKANARGDKKTGQMIMSWKEHVPNPHATSGRDFKALNKGAIVAGATTAKEQLAYRLTHDARLKLGSRERRRSTPADDVVHGIPTKPSTHMNDLIANAYRWSWVADQLELELEGKGPSKKVANPAPTKASMGHASTAHLYAAAGSAEQATAKEVFVMKRFKNIPAKVTAFMPPRAVTAAPKPKAREAPSREAE